MIRPRTIQKYVYYKTATWKVHVFQVFGFLSWGLIMWALYPISQHDPFFRYFVYPILVVFSVVYVTDLIIYLAYRRPDLDAHLQLVKQYKKTPSVDIFLPIYNEDFKVIANTWKYVSQLYYPRKKVYVLEDSTEDVEKHRALARRYGFHFIERLNKGENKKAGNLLHAFYQTKGDFILILDADFAPHTDILKELLPYTEDNTVGIVTSPQYFGINKDLDKQSIIARIASYQVELFYRFVQQGRTRWHGAINTGTNGVYRRAAIESIGGFRQVGASEDSRTGYAVQTKGWKIKFVPVILAVGLHPETIYGYFHMIHRWTRGRTELVFSKEFWIGKTSLWIKFCGITGWLTYATRPLSLLVMIQLFWTLFIYNPYINFQNSLIFFPHLFFLLVWTPLIHYVKWRPYIFYGGVIQVFASTHSLITTALRKRVPWVSSGGMHTEISSAFRQTKKIVTFYITLYLFLFFNAAILGYLHVSELRMYSILLWLFMDFVMLILIKYNMEKFIKARRST